MSASVVVASGMPGILIDQSRLISYPIHISQFSDEGCLVGFAEKPELPESVAILTKTTDGLIPGRIVEDLPEGTKVEFVWERARREKRAEPRRDVHIPAMIRNAGTWTTVAGTIVNASRSGCRIEGPGVDRLAVEIDIELPSMAKPLRGRIVWRKMDVIGVELVWQYANQPVSRR